MDNYIDHISNEYISERYYELINYFDKKLEKLGESKLIQNGSIVIDQSQKFEIPTGYLFGIPKNSINFLILVAYEITKFSNCILDIGSGKGYLARLLSNYFQLNVFCVDSEIDRLTSTIRWNRLLENNIESSNSVFNIDGKKNVSGNIKICNQLIKTSEEFNSIWTNAVSFFENKNKNEIKDICIIGIRVCGDIYYEIINWVSNLKTNSNELRINSVNLLIIPCCFESCKKYPLTTEMKDLEKKLGPVKGIDLKERILMDMFFYLYNNLRFNSVKLKYVGDCYVAFSAKLKLN